MSILSESAQITPLMPDLFRLLVVVGRILTLPPERRLQAAATWQMALLPRKRGVPFAPLAHLRGQCRDAPVVVAAGPPAPQL